MYYCKELAGNAKYEDEWMVFSLTMFKIQADARFFDPVSGS